jgi:hypothetical protein
LQTYLAVHRESGVLIVLVIEGFTKLVKC